ncbi:2-oxoacid:acceptor oxidoreductase subunit alpha [Flavobacteriales bacterium]|jgi:2-oxoglutarate ferredoxin oxidoreductase subunit alpha|nr:2-oxoacid:acceptor oxidoreductase subunit alpha [Flavobacteriales bacterium]MDA8945539.1 2-oxoacid:acceptor oxidoreductase subunit alpha [Flavobacteriales bacterium]MDG1145325.1 2-oxoacid:acceptor oxidoreductase subunit alpha [Flavobacteriales bacterium]MDG1395853.1 2-oxoacid:acceptor oxidoreductase subunit alpha [Flavobacteriales bacterium]
MTQVQHQLEKVTILFAGDSGDGIQLTGTQFTTNTALFGNDLSTFPDFPAEIRAPLGTVAGVSGFQINFGAVDVYTPGDLCDVLVVMNVAALKKNLTRLKERGTIIVNTAGFDKRNLRLAGVEEGQNPLLNNSLEGYKVHEFDITKLTRESLKDSSLGTKDRDRCKNMFVLGFVYWMYNRKIDSSISFLKTKFSSKPEVLNANIAVLKAGYHFADTCETFSNRFEVKPTKMPSGSYRNIIGNQATALGLIAAAHKSKLDLFYSGYPITPASDILHELAKHKNFGVKTFQAEDEIAAICSAIGASFGGDLPVTASSGPGIALKGEALGLAMMLELPLVIVNVQRGGPSTGLPTKTEQADLLQAVYGRNGEAPIPVIAASSPSDCFTMAYEACRIAIEHMTPVFLLSDGYIANGAEPWRYPTSDTLKPINVTFAKERLDTASAYLPYKRDEKLVREWALPGTKGVEHRLGGLEKDKETGNVSYDPDNHQFMVKVRAEKIAKIADYIPEQHFDTGSVHSKMLILGWGSTYGSIKTVVRDLATEGIDVAHAHLKYIQPMPKNLGDLLAGFDKILIPEINNGQLITLIRDQYLVDAQPLNKIKGVPFESREIKEAILNMLKQ